MIFGGFFYVFGTNQDKSAMSCIPRSKALRRRNRRKRMTGSFFRRVGRFFAALFSCFPCVTHPDMVQSWTSYSGSNNEPVDYKERSCGVRSQRERVLRVIRRSDSLLETISERDTPVPDEVEFDYGDDDDSIVNGDFAEQIRTETRLLGPAPEITDGNNNGVNIFEGREKTKIVGKENVGSCRQERGMAIQALRCATPFKVPIKQLSFSKMAEDTIISDVESLKEVRNEKAVEYNKMKRPEMQSGRDGKDNYKFCGADDDDDIEELQEITCTKNDDKELQNDGDSEIDLTIQGVGCYSPQNQEHTPPNVPLGTSFLPPKRVLGSKCMSAKANKEIDRILLGNNRWFDGMNDGGNKIGDSKKTKKEKKSKKNEKRNKAEKNEAEDTILGPLPPIPTAKFGVQVGTWVGNEEINKELKSKLRKDKKEREKKEKKEKKERAKKEKKEKKKTKENSTCETKGQKEEKLPSDQVIKMNAKNGPESYKIERVFNYILNSNSYEQDNIENRACKLDAEKIGDHDMGKGTNNKKQKKSKNKEKKKKSMTGKIGEALSELMNEPKDVNKTSNSQKMKGKKDKSKPSKMKTESITGDENNNGENHQAQMDDDFFHPRHRPTSKERPPGRGNPYKGGLFLIETPITPPEIVPNETVGHCCRYCDYLAKLHERNLEKMTPYERQLADEEERRMKKEEINCKRRLQAYCQDAEVELMQKQKAVSRIAQIMKKTRKNNPKSETKRLIFVQPINEEDSDDCTKVR